MAEPVKPKNDQLWTSAEVARAFRVGVSSIKRWTDEGELETVRTIGGHRRYTLPAMYRFASIRSVPVDRLPRLEQTEMFDEAPERADISLYDALASGDIENVRQLVVPHVKNTVQRATFLDRVIGEALREIGYRWERGELGVADEHRASHMLTEAIDRLRPRVDRTAPLAALACPHDEWHELPLHLLRLVLEWSGWRTEMAGAHLPWSAARELLSRSRPVILAFTARTSKPFQEPEFESLVQEGAMLGTSVIAGGEWARGGGGAEKDSFLRFRTLRGFERWLRTQGSRIRSAPLMASGARDRGPTKQRPAST